MATYLEIQERVQVNVIDLPTPVQNAIPRLINRAQRKIQQKHNFFFMKAATTFNTVAAPTRSSTTSPSDFKEFRDKLFWTPDEGKSVEMTHAPTVTSATRRFASDDEGPPELLLRVSATVADGSELWYVYPLSDSNADTVTGEYPITVNYWKYLPELSADDDSNWFTVNADDYLEYLATSHAFRMDWDIEQADYWAQQALIEYGEILRIDKLRVLSGIDTLVPHLDYYEPQLTR